MPGEFIPTTRVVQSRKSDWPAIRPGTTYDDEARFIVRHVEVLSYSEVRNAGPHRLFRLLQRRNASEISARCLRAKILFQAMN